MDHESRHRHQEIWLVRHGESTGNVSGLLQGQEDHPLSTLGEGQARALAKRLREVPFSAVYSSDLMRARTTADIVCADRSEHRMVDPTLREIDAGGWSGMSLEQVRSRFPEEHAAWMTRRDPDLRRGGTGETYREAQQRIISAIELIAQRHSPDRVLVVAHGGVIRAYLAHLLRLDLARIWHLAIDNTAICRVRPFAEVNPGDSNWRGRVMSINDCAHLDGTH